VKPAVCLSKISDNSDFDSSHFHRATAAAVAAAAAAVAADFA